MRRKIDDAAAVNDEEDSRVIDRSELPTISGDEGPVEPCSSSNSPSASWEARRGGKRKIPLTHSIDNILGGVVDDGGGTMITGVTGGGFHKRAQAVSPKHV